MDVSTPKEKRNKLRLQFINGYPFTAFFPRKYCEQTLSFRPNPGDIFVAGYPKSGTTWLQYIVWDIVNDGAPLPIVNDIWSKDFIHLEMVGTDRLHSLPSPRLLKVNLTFQYTPFDESAKYLYITRNPFDVCVSFYKFMKMLDENYGDTSFDDWFETFMKGEVSNGDYFAHVSSWYSRRGYKNILFLNYEELKSDPKHYVLKISRFLDEAYYQKLVQNPRVLEQIVENTEFGNMKQSCSFYWDLTERGTFEPKERQTKNNPVQFFRKGTVGDWKNYLSESQCTLLREKIEDQLCVEELISLWKKIGLL